MDGINRIYARGTSGRRDGVPWCGGEAPPEVAGAAAGGFLAGEGDLPGHAAALTFWEVERAMATLRPA